MSLKNEQQVLSLLELDSWKNLSNDKMMKFANIMPSIDKDVLIKIIGQFPEFRLFALDLLKSIEFQIKNTLSDNNESRQMIHESTNELRIILKNQLEDGVITFKEKRYFIEKLLELYNKELDYDEKNKTFISDLLSKSLTTTATILVAALVFVGGKVLVAKKYL